MTSELQVLPKTWWQRFLYRLGVRRSYNPKTGMDTIRIGPPNNGVVLKWKGKDRIPEARLLKDKNDE